ncbi:penicillin-binding protein 1B [Eionea flava]
MLSSFYLILRSIVFSILPPILLPCAAVAKKPASKKKPTKKTPAKRKSRSKKSSALWQRFLPSWVTLFKLFAVIFIVFCLWLVMLDVQVREKFNGKKWAIPARVYARPLEIYEGLLLNPEELKRELNSVGYRHVKQVYDVGQYAIKGSTYTIFTRDFVFPDKAEVAARYQVTLSQQSVASQVSRVVGADDDLTVRIEPQEIGSIYPRHGEDRILVQLENTPPLLGQALIAVEDKDFANHHGISFRGIARAMLANIKAGRFVQGGSTLTQQLVKNFYLTQDKNVGRKIQEALMAPLLELHYSKADILEAYINEVYLGQSGPRGIHGFGLASKHYFNRALDRLQPHQIALLVGTVKGASYYNPWRHPERAKNRRDTVLKLMADSGLLTAADYKKYTAMPLGVVKKSTLRLGDYPAFLDVVKRQLQRDYDQDDLQSEGLRIFTTMSPGVQAITESAVSKRLSQFTPRTKKQVLQGAAVVTAVGSGEIVALVGDKNPRYSGFNRAVDMQRSIGSLVKPFVFLSALSQPNRYTLSTLLDDSPVTIPLDTGKQWQPKNFDKKSHGNIPLYQALAYSYNQSTARMGMEVGLRHVIETLKAAGLEQSVPALPSLLLGSLELSPLELSHLYHTLAADGVYTPLRAIRDVLDASHARLSRYPLKSEPRLNADAVYLMHYNLQAVMRMGTGRRAYQQLPDSLAVAGKTGTTNRQRDSWFAGYSADHLGIVWVGADNNTPTSYTGSSGALPIWADVFSALSTESLRSEQPDNIAYYWADSRDGLLSTENCEGAILVPYIRGSQPEQSPRCQTGGRSVTGWFKQWLNDAVTSKPSDANTRQSDTQERGMR